MKELIAKLLTFVVMTGVGAIVYGLIALVAHHFATVLNWALVVAVFWFTGFVVNEVYQDIKQRKGGAK